MAPSHLSVEEIHPLNENVRDSTIIVASAVSGKKHTHEARHLDSNKEAKNMAEPSSMELLKRNDVIDAPNNSIEWIDTCKRKGKKEKSMKYNARISY